MREVCPHSLAFVEQMWYVVSTNSADEMRLFRVDRIEAIEILRDTFERNAELASKLSAAGRAFYSTTDERMTVRYSPRIARWLAEREGKELDADGGLTLEHPLADESWAIRHVLQYGPDAELLRPRDCAISSWRSLPQPDTKVDAPLAHHLVAVWNPSYARNAIEEHLAVLLRDAAALGEKRVRDEDVYVWWGLVHSRNRRTELPHMDSIRAIDDVLSGDDPPETHLYLTDYQSLYVAELGEIRFEALSASEALHVPSYYATDRLECDCWFKLWDVRRLVANDMLATIEELKQLHSVAYFDRPVSLYGGMVDLPLVVTRPDGLSYFDEGERDVSTNAQLWAEFDAQMGAGLVSVERSLRDDLLGEAAWNALDPPVRTFVATAEKLFREHRLDSAFDFAGVIGSFAKALEVQLGSLLRRVLPELPRQHRLMNIDGATIDLTQRRGLSLSQLVQVLAGDQARTMALTQLLVNGGWLTGQFAAVLDEFRAVRNEGTHESRIDRKTATHWRNQMLRRRVHGAPRGAGKGKVEVAAEPATIAQKCLFSRREG